MEKKLMKIQFLYPTLILLLLLAMPFNANCEDNFDYSIELVPISNSKLPGLHSYAFAQHNGHWLIIGGRTDGMHARQPFASFPASDNNTFIYVVDNKFKEVSSASINSLPTDLKEQLQSTNMNFYQDDETLYIIGGYAFSISANDHITFPYLTSINVPALIEAIIAGEAIEPYFKQIKYDIFAVTGGQMGKLGDVFYLVGGQRFDGRYNPMGNGTYTQTYTNEIRKFTIDNSADQLSYSNYTAINNPVHLHRRDYNLMPQIFPDASQGYMISSGVFQVAVDLPYLYPVDINENGIEPKTDFNQYLSNYHSASASIYDSENKEMHSIFFGGMSQYYYQDGELIKDDKVPFVKTISRVTRYEDGILQEFQMPIEMPGLLGASAEFIPNLNLAHYSNEVIKLSEIDKDTVIIGHIFGGISSPSLNPFSTNQSNTTIADENIYEVRLIKDSEVSVQEIDGSNPYSINVFPNPAGDIIEFEFKIEKLGDIQYILSSTSGQILQQGSIKSDLTGLNKKSILINKEISQQVLIMTVIFDGKFYVTEKIIRK
jgi:hypothetical protein